MVSDIEKNSHNSGNALAEGATRRFYGVMDACAGVVEFAPLQTVTVEPNEEVIEWAEWMYQQNDPDKDRDEYIREMAVDAVRLKVELET
jgi:hypothetical protein